MSKEQEELPGIKTRWREPSWEELYESWKQMTPEEKDELIEEGRPFYERYRRLVNRGIRTCDGVWNGPTVEEEEKYFIENWPKLRNDFKLI